MKIKVNGEEREVPEGFTLLALLESLGLHPSRVAVERNLEVVPREKYAETVLEEGDELEIVHFVGGGLFV
jgi:thiamine biosynthesis protein ThiS